MNPTIRKLIGALGMASLAAGATAWAGSRVFRPIPAAILASGVGVGIGYIAWPKAEREREEAADTPAMPSEEA